MTEAPRFKRREPYDHTGSQRPTRSTFLLLSQCDVERVKTVDSSATHTPNRTKDHRKHKPDHQSRTQQEELAPRKAGSSSGARLTRPAAPCHTPSSGGLGPDSSDCELKRSDQARVIHRHIPSSSVGSDREIRRNASARTLHNNPAAL
jgi:hypothetical protein